MYATMQRKPRELWRVIDRDGKPLPGVLEKSIGGAMGAAALADATEPNGPYTVEAAQPVVPTWMGKRVA